MNRDQPMPCPVLLGKVKSGGLPALLHRYTSERKVSKLEKILKKGVDVDSINHLGQTPLFCASLLGFSNIVEKLLEYRANPNHQCFDLSTPVHAAVFSCDPWLLSALLDAGGDLRLHDDHGRTPRDWAETGAQKNSPRMLAFLQRCKSQMQSMLQTPLPRDVWSLPTSSKMLLSSPSPHRLLQPWVTGIIPEHKLSATSYAYDVVKLCFGYGKLCFVNCMLSVGLSASVAVISDNDLCQAEDEPFNSFMCGSFIRMTNYSWKGCRVTVKELHDQILHQRDGHNGLMDLLIAEQEYCCQLSNPHLLLLMAVSMSADLNHTRLVYERVNLGSLFSLLHQRREEFPLLQVVDLLSVVLQVCEVLMYLHGRSLVLRALSSHTVLMVDPGVAKVTGLGFMVPSEETCTYAPPPVPLPLSLVNWAAPEVIKCKECTGKADIYSLCALIQEIYTDDVPWGSTDPHCIKKSVGLGQALIAHPAVPQPYYQYLETGLQRRAQDRTRTLQDLCYMLRSYIKEFRSENKRKRWTTGINHMRECDQPAYQEAQELLRCLQRETTERESHNLFQTVHTEDEQSTTDTDDLHPFISHCDIAHLQEWPMSHDACDSSVHDSLSETACFLCSYEEKYQAISHSISNHTGSIVLNHKISQVLLKQAERSLDIAEGAQAKVPCFDEVDAGKFGGVAESVKKENESSDGCWKAVGPPNTNYIPKWTTDGETETSQYSSAQEDSFDSGRYSRSQRVEGTEREQQQTGCHNTYQSLEGNYQAKPTWTSEVSEIVARMTRGQLGTQMAAVGSTDSEDGEEQQLHLQGWQGHESYPESETRESSDLEQLFKGFAGIQSDSEESTDLQTINHTFDLTNRVQDSQTEEVDSESDYIQSPAEPNTVFYTPKLYMSDSSTGDKHSQSLSSDEELDVTVEVCHTSTTPEEGKHTTENSLSEYQPAHDSEETESITPVQSCLPDLAEIADLSSISHSPAQHQKCVGSTAAPPTSQDRGHQPCNSTPRGPRSRRTRFHKVQVGTEYLPQLRSLMDTLPMDTLPPSQSLCAESYVTADSGDSTATNDSASSILQSAAVKNISKENTDSPSSANAEFTTASSEARHTTENSQETTEEMECPTGAPGEAEMRQKESENIMCLSHNFETSEQPSNSGSVNVMTGEEEKNDAYEQAGDDLVDHQSFDEQELDDEKISEGQEGAEDETQCQRHDQDPDLNANVDSNANSQKSTDKSSDDTERANSTLDDELQRMVLERATGLRTSRGPFSQSDTKGERDVKDGL